MGAMAGKRADFVKRSNLPFLFAHSLLIVYLHWRTQIITNGCELFRCQIFATFSRLNAMVSDSERTETRSFGDDLSVQPVAFDRHS